MLLAHEARDKSAEMIRRAKTDELAKIEKGIMESINLGKFEYIYDGYISVEARDELMRCGYQVTTGSQYNQGWVEIDWKGSQT